MTDDLSFLDDIEDLSFLDDIEITEERQPKRTLLGTLGDVGVTGLKGAVGLVESGVGLADLATGGEAGKFLNEAGLRTQETQEILSEAYSPAQKYANEQVQNAEGFLGTASELLDNPSTIGHGILESAPQMLGGGLIAKGAQKIGMGVLGASALGEGVVAAGSGAESVRQQTDDGLLTDRQALLSGLSGATTAGFNRLGGGIAKKYGFGDIDTFIAQRMAGQAATGQSKKSIARNVIEGMISEGLIEEMPQSAAEQMFSNAALERPLMDGVAEAAGTGAVIGGAMGGGFNAANSLMKPKGPLSRAANQAPKINTDTDGKDQSETSEEVHKPDEVIYSSQDDIAPNNDLNFQAGNDLLNQANEVPPKRPAQPPNTQGIEASNEQALSEENLRNESRNPIPEGTGENTNGSNGDTESIAVSNANSDRRYSESNTGDGSILRGQQGSGGNKRNDSSVSQEESVINLPTHTDSDGIEYAYIDTDRYRDLQDGQVYNFDKGELSTIERNNPAMPEGTTETDITQEKTLDEASAQKQGESKPIYVETKELPSVQQTENKSIQEIPTNGEIKNDTTEHAGAKAEEELNTATTKGNELNEQQTNEEGQKTEIEAQPRESLDEQDEGRTGAEIEQVSIPADNRLVTSQKINAVGNIEQSLHESTSQDKAAPIGLGDTVTGNNGANSGKVTAIRNTKQGQFISTSDEALPDNQKRYFTADKFVNGETDNTIHKQDAQPKPSEETNDLIYTATGRPYAKENRAKVIAKKKTDKTGEQHNAVAVEGGWAIQKVELKPSQESIADHSSMDENDPLYQKKNLLRQLKNGLVNKTHPSGRPLLPDEITKLNDDIASLNNEINKNDTTATQKNKTNDTIPNPAGVTATSRVAKESPEVPAKAGNQKLTYHPAIESMASDLVDGGGITVDKENRRNKSLNPNWYKEGAFVVKSADGKRELKTIPSVSTVKMAVDDYISGKKLKPTQVRILEKMDLVASAEETFAKEKFNDEELAFARMVNSLIIEAKEVGLDGAVKSAIDRGDIDNLEKLQDWQEDIEYAVKDATEENNGDSPNGELGGYTQEEVTKRESEQKRREQKEAETELNHKQKDRADRGVDSLVDDMLGAGTNGDIFGGNAGLTVKDDLGVNNVPNTTRTLEQDEAGDKSLQATIQDTGKPDRQDSTDGRKQTGTEGAIAGERDTIPEDRPITEGAESNKQLPTGKQESITSTTGSVERGGGRESGEYRVPNDDHQTTSKSNDVYEKEISLADKVKLQKLVEGKKNKKSDIDNIRETLPVLMPEQQDDVLHAEDRFKDDDGFMLTNGTGTGKTFSGLGIIKRFAKDGKNNIVIVAPNSKVANDWINSGKHLLLDITKLKNTGDKGNGIVVTSYENFRENSELLNREYDLLVFDESHKLNSNQAGTSTKAQTHMRMAANLYGYDGIKASAIHNKELMALKGKVEAEIKRLNKKNGEIYENTELAKHKYEKQRIILDAKVNKTRVKINKQQKSKVLFLSASPFAYHKSMQYADGFLFESGAHKPQTGNEDTGYNVAQGFDSFLASKLGYKMRTGLLNSPDADVDTSLAEKNINDELKESGALSGRSLVVKPDYSREFVLINDAIGSKIDEGIEFLQDNNEEYSGFSEQLRKRFDYLNRLRLLEALKAHHAIDRIKKHHNMGRKVVVFHDYKTGNAANPFNFTPTEHVKASDIKKFRNARPDLINLDLNGLGNVISTLTSEFPDALVFNGDTSKDNKIAYPNKFNDDNGDSNLIIALRAAGKEGISLHDTTGKYQRVLIDMGLPIRPTDAIQTEGRIYRALVKTNAIIEYFSTGLNYEATAFAQAIAQRSGTAENLAMGHEARDLLSAFVNGYSEPNNENPSTNQGVGGKEGDRYTNEATQLDQSKLEYHKQQKNSKTRENKEGKDYYATPEPVGLAMTQWADLKPNESALEPSAGHGAIARYFPSGTNNTFIEPSYTLAPRLGLLGNGTVKNENFEDLNIINKYDSIIMNPPFGMGGSTAIKHIEKAFNHLRDGGRIIAIVPKGAMDNKLESFMEKTDSAYTVANIQLPSITFKKAGTGVSTQIVIIDKVPTRWIDDGAELPNHRWLDYRSTEKINELFDSLNEVDIAGRTSKPETKENTKFSKAAKPQSKSTVAQIRDLLPRRVKRLLDSGNLKVVQSVDALPKHLQDAGAALYQAAFHGTPHDFDKFTTDEIGTGEGAQTYGWGLYFTGNKEIAEWYRDKLGNPTGVFSLQADGISIPPDSILFDVANFVKVYGIEETESLLKENDATNEYFEALGDLKGKKITSPNNTGKLYEVELAPKEDEYLLWDKPLSEQSDKVKKAINDYTELNADGYVAKLENSATGEEIYKSVIKDTRVTKNTLGKGILNDNADKLASENLHFYNIRGIKYLDGTSRSKGEGNYNYVIFNDNDVEITAKKSTSLEGIEGLYDKSMDTVYIVADMLDKDNLNGLLNHELFHRARAADPKLQKQLTELDSRIQKKFNLAAKGVGTKAEIKAFNRVMDANTSKADQIEEYQAYLITAYSTKPESLSSAMRKWVKDLIATIRAALIRQGMIPRDITPADLNALAKYGAKVSRDLSRGNPAGKTGKANNTVALASKQGYKGDDNSEAKEWLEAVSAGLDMSHAGRMKRAKDMGFDVDTTWYHGGAKGITSVDDVTPERGGLGAFYLTSEKMVAANYALANGVYLDSYELITDGEKLGRARREAAEMSEEERQSRGINIDFTEKRKIYKLLTKTNKEIRPEHITGDDLLDILGRSVIDESFNAWEYELLEQELGSSEPADFSDEQIKNFIDSNYSDLDLDDLIDIFEFDGQMLTEASSAFKFLGRSRLIDKFLSMAESKGYDAVMIASDWDTMQESDTLIVRNPSQVRSIHAAFNPANADSNNLLASIKKAGDTTTEQFKKWFANSKMKKGGKPIKFYHGTNADFTVFDKNKLGENTTHTTAGLGHFFTADKATADNYGDSTHEVYLSMQNPYVVTSELLDQRMGDDPQSFSDTLKERGFDGIYVKDAKYAIAFESNQVKLTSNESPTSNSDIRFSRASDADTNLKEFKRKAGMGKKKTLADTIKNILTRGVDANKQAIKDYWNEIKAPLEQGIFDKFLGIKLAEKEVKGNVLHSMSGYIGARFSTGSSSTMAGVLQHGSPVWSEGVISRKDGTKGFAEMLQPVKDDLENFTLWMVARRADRLFSEGKENNFNEEELKAGLALEQDSYQGVADDIAKLNKDILDVAEKAGIVDPKSRKLFESNDYIPFYRMVEGNTMGPKGKRGLSHQSSGIKMLKGGENPMSDPLGNMMQNWSHLIDASMKNSALDKTLTNLDGSRFVEKRPSTDFKQAIIPKSQIKAIMLESGLPKEVVDAMPTELTEGMAKMWSMVTPTDPDVVRVMRDGKAEYFKVNDTMLLNSLTSINQDQLGGIFKPMRYMKRLLTASVTATPAFMARNFIRDSVHSWTIAEEKGFKLGVSSIHGAVKSFNEEGGYIDMMFAGASFQGGYGNYNNPDSARESMDSVLRRNGIKDVQGFKESIIDTPKKYWEMYRAIGDAIENSNREAILEISKKAGNEKAQYLFESKDIMDFSMGGTFAIVRALSDMLPFFSARLTGIYRLSKAGKTKEATSMMVAKGTGIALASLALLAINSDNDDYEALEDWEKDTYWHIFAGGEHFRIPKPFELGLIFGTIPERSARALIGTDTMGKFTERMAHGAGDTLSLNPIPQMFKPIVEIYANKNMFTRRPIEGMADEGKLPSARYNEYTSDTMRALSSALPESLGASPKRLEHLIGGYLGSMGMYILGASDLAVRAMNGSPDKPTMRIDRLPLVKVFYQESPALHTKYGTDLYDMLNEVNEVYRTINAYKKEGLNDKARKLRDDNVDKLRQRGVLNRGSKSVSAIRKRINSIMRSDLSPAMKRADINKLMDITNDRVRKVVDRTSPYFR